MIFVVKILEFKEKLKQIVLPIFCYVDSSQVQKQTGSFGEALAIHKVGLFVAQIMEKWTPAVGEAANLSGWDLRNFADGHQSKFMGNIIKQVLQEINQTPLEVAWYPSGVDTRVKDIELLLRNECVDEVHIVGIGGIGKNIKLIKARPGSKKF